MPAHWENTRGSEAAEHHRKLSSPEIQFALPAARPAPDFWVRRPSNNSSERSKILSCYRNPDNQIYNSPLEP